MITGLHRLSDPAPGAPAWAGETKVIPIITGKLSGIDLPIDGVTHESYLTGDESRFARILARLRHL